MNDSDESLDHLLGSYLNRELRGQTGRAAARFLQEVQSPSAIAQLTRRPGRVHLWWAPLIGTIAAAVGLAWGVAVWHQGSLLAKPGKSGSPQVGAATAPAPTVTEADQTYTDTIDVRTIDEGTVVLNDKGPARQFRREVIEHVEWFDPAQNKRIQIDIPSEEVVLVAMNTY